MVYTVLKRILFVFDCKSITQFLKEEKNASNLKGYFSLEFPHSSYFH